MRVDGTFGYRYYNMSDHLDIHEKVFITNTGTQVQVGTAFGIDERFHASNTFHGGELGMVARVDKGCWSFEFLAKMALGNNHQRVLIDGQTVVAVPNQTPVTYQGGLLALPTNIGVYERDRFAIIPQFGMEVGLPGDRATLGSTSVTTCSSGITSSAPATRSTWNVNPTQIPPGQLVGAPGSGVYLAGIPTSGPRESGFGAELRF